ncbi:MAG: hypothetical protein K5851_07470 [Lachnospiraceae bacterium]|nr:hypothetical protein [Lachnospiraceae bacterium]
MVLVLSVSKEVYADTSSNWTYASVGGQSYHFRSEVSTRNNRAEGVANVIHNGGNVPTGYMGAQARLYNSNGVLKSAGQTIYNTIPSVNLYAYTSSVGLSGFYYAQCTVYLYNGNGYNSYSTNKSPNAGINSHIVHEECAIINGKIYASGLCEEELDEEIDYILAEGIYGKVGYVFADELSVIPEGPLDAVECSNQAFESRMINVYDLDGNVIDYFKVNGMDKNKLDSLY